MNLITLESLSLTVALIGVVVSVLATSIALRRSARRITIHISEDLKPEKCVGLILLVGPARGSAPDAIQFHLPMLKYCWLIGTEDSLSTIQFLINENESIKFFWGDNYTINPDEVRSTYDVVSRILTEEIPAIDLQPDTVIADITGGLKPMSAGLSLACTEHQRLMQFMKAPRDSNGVVIRGGVPEPVKLEFRLQQGRNSAS